MIELERVSKRYGDVHAVEEVSLRIGAGQIFGLIGHNGAGKSTLLKMMLGIEPVSEGAIRIQGRAVRGAGFRELRRGIGYLPENVALYDNLSGLETLRFFARLKSADPAQCPALLERVGLSAAMHRSVRGYSKGMRQRLGFAQALLGQPRLLFLDEPTNGLDPAATHAFYDTLDALRREGATVLISSHLLAEIQSRVDALAIVANGRLVAEGTVAALSAAADLPAQARVAVRAEVAAEVAAALAGAGFAPQASDGDAFAFAVPRARKTALLPVLAAFGDAMTGFELREPTLEDVFLRHGTNPRVDVGDAGAHAAGAEDAP